MVQNSDKGLNSIGHQLREQLVAAKRSRREYLARRRDSSQLISVPGVGRVVSMAYEQLRNAAEYTQEHLLRQKAIRRYYVRNVSFYERDVPKRAVAEELIVELTQVGYVENDSLPISVIDELHSLIERRHHNYWRLRDTGISFQQAQEITLELLSVESEKMIDEDFTRAIYVQFAYLHYQKVLDKQAFAISAEDAEQYEASLYVAVHRALLKSDIANVRFDMQRLYQTSDQNIKSYADFHKNINKIFESDITDRLTRYINRHGAPLRVLRGFIEETPDADALLKDPQRFLLAYEARIRHEYEVARTRLNRGVIKSIIFLLITKALIGLAIEIPYDLIVYGVILFVPLLINLFTPIVYMAVLRAGLRLPGEANTKAILSYAQKMLYAPYDSETLLLRPRKKQYAAGFTVVYVLAFLGIFALVISQLIALEFNIVQGAIFFVFLATASFLGFRLSRIVRELEIVASSPGLLATVRDFLYMPFILLGQWLSEKYERVNVVALVLDTMIELPLKTILRLARQWTSFINEKKDEI